MSKTNSQSAKERHREAYHRCVLKKSTLTLQVNLLLSPQNKPTSLQISKYKLNVIQVACRKQPQVIT